MSPNNRHLSRRIRLTVYSLKRMYGGLVFLYRNGDPETNLRTGVKTWPNKEVVRVEKAIILPVKIQHGQEQTISMISADKKFVYGGYTVKGARWFYIDPRDLPSGYEIKADDYIVYDGKQYDIKDIRDNEFDTLWEVLAVEIEGVIPQQIQNLSAKHIMDFKASAEVV